MACPHTWFVAAQMAMVDAMRRGRKMSREERIKNGLDPQIVNDNFYEMSESKRHDLSLHELHTGPDVLIKSVKSLEDDHRYLLAINGPFGENFDVVLAPYVETVLNKDADREICRKSIHEEWKKAQSKTYFNRISKNELMRHLICLRPLN